MALFYTGSRAGQEYRDLWATAQSVDLTLQHEYLRGGYPSVIQALNTDDRIEHWMARLGSQLAYLRAGKDEVLRESLQTAKAPGDCDVLPSWYLESTRATMKQEAQARARVPGGGGAGGGGGASSSTTGGGQAFSAGRRPRRRNAAATPTTAAAASGSGGGGGGKPTSGAAAPQKKV